VLRNLAEALEIAKLSPGSTVKLNVYLAKAEAMPEVQRVLALQFRGSIKPAVSFVVGSLPNETDALVAMDAVAPCRISTQVPGQKDSHVLQHRNTSTLNGSYFCNVLLPGPKFYVSGMADTNNLPEATRKTLEKLVAAIGHLGLKKTDIVQLKAFLQPMSEVGVVRTEIVNFFAGAAPPVVFVEWISPAPNPPIEIELIASGGGDFSKEVEPVSFLTPPGTMPSKVFSRVARVNHGKLIYVSGLYGMKAGDSADRSGRFLPRWERC